jgi:molecular chaperone HtpG
MQHAFQVNLGGLIDVLSGHLYANPEVFVRELIQNAADALVARQALETIVPEPSRLNTFLDDGRPPLECVFR